jgi:8-oxo-dGTP diphosphatase
MDKDLRISAGAVIIRDDKILFVEDLISPRQRTTKIWFLCKITGGELTKTQNAIDEGVVDARWFKKSEIINQDVYPTILLDSDWQQFSKDTWTTQYIESTADDETF